MFLDFDTFFIIFSFFPLIVIGFILFMFFKSMKAHKKNAKLPRLTVFAKVVTKRTHHSHSKNTVGFNYYYVTFEVESTDRFELSVPSSEFGYLVEGDEGFLTFQGNMFLEFKRNTN